MHGNSLIVDAHGRSNSCMGCIYWVTLYGQNTNLKKPCEACSRRYQDYYTAATYTESAYIAPTTSAVNNTGDNYGKGKG